MTVTAERPMLADTQLLDERGLRFSPSLRNVVEIEDAEQTAGLTYEEINPHGFVAWRLAQGWPRLAEQVSKIVLLSRPADVKLRVLEDERLTLSFSAPAFEVMAGTGYLFQELRDSIDTVRRQLAALAPSTIADVVTSLSPSAPLELANAASSAALEVVAPRVLDVPDALRAARAQAGLPVQDLAAMFGIKRRQFYNLISGEDAPDPSRERRIARVTEAIGQISERVGGNSRRARSVLLARLDGDSIYDAAVTDDEERLAGALERALAATSEAVVGRLAPSRRATREEAAAVRDFLRATRDETGRPDSDGA